AIQRAAFAFVISVWGHCSTSLFLSRASGALNLAVGLWSLKIKRDNVGAGFSRPIASITNQGGGKPPPRRIAWSRLIFKDHKHMGWSGNISTSRERRLNSIVAHATGKFFVQAPWVSTHWYLHKSETKDFQAL